MLIDENYMKLTYTIPESKKDLTTEQYISISKLRDEAVSNETEIDNNEVMAICLGIPKLFVDKLPLKEYQRINSIISDVLKEETDLYLTFEFEGVKYGFINDLENISGGEYAALENLLQDVNKNYCGILNVLYRPIVKEKNFKSWFSRKDNKKYNIVAYNSERDSKHFKKLPCVYLEGGLGFFYNLGNDLLSATLKYTAAELEKQTKEAQLLEKNGVGFKHLIRTLMQNELILMKSNTSTLIKYCLD